MEWCSALKTLGAALPLGPQEEMVMEGMLRVPILIPSMCPSGSACL